MDDATRWVTALAADGGAVAATDPGDLDRPVPTCPGWTVRDLIVHLGAVHRWAARFVAEGLDSTERFGFDTSDVPDGAAVLDWSAARLADLLEVLSASDPDTPTRVFGGVGQARFWFRRQAHETAVHRWDVQNACGVADPIAPDLAADGVAEWFDVFVPRVLRKADLPEAAVGAVVGVRPSDAAGCTYRLTADGAVAEPGARPSVVLRGTASDLVLALWRRRAIEDVVVSGDTPAATALLDTVRV